MAETPRGPGAAPPDDEYAQLQRRLNEQVLERAAADPEWRQRLIEDPETAMADIPEARQVREQYESARPTELPDPEVVGQHQQQQQWCPWFCYWYTWYWDRPWWSWYQGGGPGGGPW